MFKRMLITMVAAVAGLCLCLRISGAAASSPTLEGEQLVHAAAADVQSKCYYDSIGWNAWVNYQASGTASGSYAGTFASSGTARLSASFGYTEYGLTEFDGSFSIASPTGSLKGTLRRVYGTSVGTGTCNAAASAGTFQASALVYTVTLSDGTIDQGSVDLALVDDLANSRFRATFHSLRRVADMDADGVLDGLDNCATMPNADQLDTDDDGIGDVCDPSDNRLDYFDDLVASSKADSDPEGADHAGRARARRLLQRRQRGGVHRPRGVYRRRRLPLRQGDRARDRRRAHREGPADPAARSCLPKIK